MFGKLGTYIEAVYGYSFAGYFMERFKQHIMDNVESLAALEATHNQRQLMQDALSDTMREMEQDISREMHRALDNPE